MKPPEINRRTDATVQAVLEFGPDGAPLVVVIIKQRYEIAAMHLFAARPGAEIAVVDEPWDDAAPLSSVKAPSDLGLYKPGTDVVVIGEAVSRDEAPVPWLDVLVSVGPVAQALRVSGTRVWYRGAGGVVPTPPEPMVRVPLRWELSWGGADDDPPRHAADARNPVGRGVAVAPERLIHRPAPQIEDPARPIGDHRGPYVPVNVGAVAAWSSWRSRHAGTMDDAWQRERMPLRPRDFDLRHHQVAAPGLVTPEHLVGGEAVRLHNLCVTGPLAFELPRVSFGVWGVTDERETAYRVALDTVVIRPGERLLDLTWRTNIPLPRPARGLRSIRVVEKERLA
jgi:hypothetical protein